MKSTKMNRRSRVPFAAGLEITKVVRTHEQLEYSDEGPEAGLSLGQMIDQRVTALLDAAEEAQTIAVHFESTVWQTMLRSHFESRTGYGSSEAVEAY